MAPSSALRSNFTSLPSLSSKQGLPRNRETTFAPIRCGPRSNRGPLVKGRILSSEAILAIQALKRTAHNNASSQPPNLKRLLKRDLLSILRELLRQDQCTLALSVLSTLQSEYPPGGDEHDHDADLDLYAGVINCLARNAVFDRIDGLLVEVESAIMAMTLAPPRALVGSGGGGKKKGLERVVRAVVEAGKRDLTVGIVGVLRRCGCGDTWTADEYLIKVLIRGLKRTGELEQARQVEREFGDDSRVNFENLPV